MRIKHIYITKEVEPMANPDMEYPTEPIEDNDGELILNDACPNWGAIYDEIDAEYQICHLCKFDSSHEAMLAKYHSGLLPFEDREKLKDELFHQVTGGPQVDVPFNVMFKPDTLIPVDLEVEVVEVNIGGRSVKDKNGIPYDYETWTRKVLRIKP